MGTRGCSRTGQRVDPHDICSVLDAKRFIPYMAWKEKDTLKKWGIGEDGMDAGG